MVWRAQRATPLVSRLSNPPNLGLFPPCDKDEKLLPGREPGAATPPSHDHGAAIARTQFTGFLRRTTGVRQEPAAVLKRSAHLKIIS